MLINIGGVAAVLFRLSQQFKDASLACLASRLSDHHDAASNAFERIYDLKQP
jgi:hypothetical protein